MNAARSVELAPESEGRRIEVLDVLRGIAILGILVMNIRNFALPLRAFQDPFHAGGGTPSVVCWAAANALFEDKMIAILSLLFGAGIVITGGKAGRGSHAAVLLRRNLGLLALGVAHACLLWYGDILNTYAVAGLLLIPLRRLGPRILIVLGALVYAGAAVLHAWPEIYREAIHPWTLGRLPEASRRPPFPEAEAYRGSWADLAAWRAWLNWRWHVQGNLAFNLWRCAGMMLVGMGLWRAGAFRPEVRGRVAGILLTIGYLLGTPLVLWDLHDTAAAHPRLGPELGLVGWWDRTRLPGLLGSGLLALGHTGLVLRLVSGSPGRLRRAFGAVGRLALSNYLFQTAVCVVLFDGWAFGRWSRWTLAELSLFVAALWIVQSALSARWLRRFEMGPLEWALRALSYLRLPGLRRS